MNTLHITKHVETRFNVDLDTKGRIFFCRTYLPEDAILELFASSLHYAYILHNLEDKQPHFHFIVHYENAKKLKSFANLLEKLSLKYPTEEGEQKSFVEIPSNKVYAFKYLTHTDPKSKKENKLEYSSSLLKGEGFDFFDSELPQTASAIDILDDINKGASFREMATKYGRGFVTQYARYKEYATRLSEEENPRQSAWAIERTFNAYLNGNCSAVELLKDILDMVAFDLNNSQSPSLENCVKSKEFDEFIEAVADVYNERKLFYKGLDKVADLKLYGFDRVAISKSRGVSEAVKAKRWTDFGCDKEVAENA